jgi:signal transduction histidine kinase
MIIYGITFLGSGIIYVFLKDSLSKIIGLALLLFVIPNLIPLPFGQNYIPFLALLLTVTIGVGYRIKILFEERLKAEKEMKDFLTQQNTLLESQVAERTAELSHSLTELKATQSQLVQQEKLASLGQLTAGIAHEIKNPLNFVNNFSEVSMEMIEEVLEARGERREAREKNQDTRIKNQEKDESEEMEDEILEDIKANLQKIHEHGTRANGIVTSMLQHSRGGSGKMEPTDLNALIKEYVNLSFHGMRAGKNPINVDLVFDLDPELGEVSLIKEDFTRVVINLCNNAFDAMREKVKKYEVPSLPAGKAGTKYNDGAAVDESYHPKLTVSTILEKGKVRISFEDNGTGIPDEIRDKILQPFFTTKKGTEGTGLGLSITHDIVKAHGGELMVDNKPGKGVTFKIILPIT